MKCLTHNQEYKQGEYCIYCGAPKTWENRKMERLNEEARKRAQVQNFKMKDTQCSICSKYINKNEKHDVDLCYETAIAEIFYSHWVYL